jgi:hypothetical protein
MMPVKYLYFGNCPTTGRQVRSVARLCAEELGEFSAFLSYCSPGGKSGQPPHALGAKELGEFSAFPLASKTSQICFTTSNIIMISL